MEGSTTVDTDASDDDNVMSCYAVDGKEAPSKDSQPIKVDDDVIAATRRPIEDRLQSLDMKLDDGIFDLEDRDAHQTPALLPPHSGARRSIEERLKSLDMRIGMDAPITPPDDIDFPVDASALLSPDADANIIAIGRPVESIPSPSLSTHSSARRSIEERLKSLDMRLDMDVEKAVAIITPPDDVDASPLLLKTRGPAPAAIITPPDSPSALLSVHVGARRSIEDRLKSLDMRIAMEDEVVNEELDASPALAVRIAPPPENINVAVEALDAVLAADPVDHAVAAVEEDDWAAFAGPSAAVDDDDDDWGDFKDCEAVAASGDEADWDAFEESSEPTPAPAASVEDFGPVRLWDKEAREFEADVAQRLRQLLPNVDLVDASVNASEESSLAAPLLSELKARWDTERPASWRLLTDEGRRHPVNDASTIFYGSPLCNLIFAELGFSEPPLEPEMRRKMTISPKQADISSAPTPTSAATPNAVDINQLWFLGSEIDPTRPLENQLEGVETLEALRNSITNLPDLCALSADDLELP